MKPEIKRLSMEAYQKAPGLSQSRLKLLERSPAHFSYALTHPQEPTRDMQLGTVSHTAILEPHLLEKSYWIRPETYENKKGEIKKWNANATEAKDWLYAHSDRLILKASEHECMIGMRKAVMENPETRQIFEKSENEICIFAKDPEFGVIRKCRVDCLSGNTMVEVKTTDDARPPAFARIMAQKGYDIQAAWDLDLAAMAGAPKDYFVFVAIEREPPHGVRLYWLDEADIAAARERYRRLLALYCYCHETNEWPGYDTAIRMISLPGWAKNNNRLELEG